MTVIALVWQDTIEEKSILLLPLSQSATDRHHFERGPIVWDSATLGLENDERSQLGKSWDSPPHVEETAMRNGHGEGEGLMWTC